MESALADLCVEVTGNGRSVLFLHGSGSSRRSFDPQVAWLADRYRCLVWDAPGYGESGEPRFAPSLADYARCVRAVIDVVGGVEAVHLVGVSWGGLVAIEAASRWPNSFASLALIGPGFGDAARPDAAARNRARLAKFSRSKTSYVADRIQLLSRGNPDSAVYRRVASNMLNSTRSPGFDYALQTMLTSDGRETASALNLPLSLMWGSDDPVAGDNCREMAARLPAIMTFEIPDASHLANQDQPHIVNQHLHTFWQHVSTRPASTH
ncbi:MAG: alpha/beta fold hydrolase [Nocardioidaceae bacterium]